MGTVAHARGDVDTALRYFEQSLEISLEIGDKAGEGTTLNNWSAVGKRDQQRRDNVPSNGEEDGMSRRRFTKEFKVAAAQRLQSGESASALARELDVKRAKLYEWASQLERYGDDAFPGPGRRPSSQPRVERGQQDEARTAALERKVGQQALEIDFLQQALRRVEDLRHETLVSGGGGSANSFDPQRGKAS